MDRKETALIRKAQQGDRQAIGMIYQESYEDIYNYIFYRVSDQQTAEDLSSEVFIRMIRGLPDYRDRGKPVLAWLYTIARHLVIDHYRSKKSQHVLPLKDQLLEDHRPGPGKRIQQEQDGKCFRRALYTLTDDQQDVIIHRFIEQRSTAETAALLQKSTRAVRSLQHRALRSLEKALVKEDCL